MSVRIAGGRIHLEGECHVEDAEALTAALQAHPHAPLELSACRRLHSAVAQALLAFGPAIAGETLDPFLNQWLIPAVSAASLARTLSTRGAASL